jgi:uncharacterized protein YbaR (Trm112 family)
MLVCPTCNQKFLHSQVDETAVEESYRDPYRVTGGPKFTDGEKVICPNCKVESLYEKYRLVFAQPNVEQVQDPIGGWLN